MKQRYDKQTKGAGVEEWARKMNSDDPLERLEGVRSLSESTDPAAVPYLVQALGDGDMRVKAKAIDACGTARAADATPVLVQMLFLRGTSPEVEQRILAALGKIGDQRAASPIVEFLGRDLDHATRGTAIFALGDIADPATARVPRQARRRGGRTRRSSGSRAKPPPRCATSRPSRTPKPSNRSTPSCTRITPPQ